MLDHGIQNSIIIYNSIMNYPKLQHFLKTFFEDEVEWYTVMKTDL